jgi:hypothetical protein
MTNGTWRQFLSVKLEIGPPSPGLTLRDSAPHSSLGGGARTTLVAGLFHHHFARIFVFSDAKKAGPAEDDRPGSTGRRNVDFNATIPGAVPA